MPKNYFNLGLDVLIILVLLLLMEPDILGRTLHEWIGLIIGAVLITHISINWQWIKTITLNFLHKLTFRARLNYILDLLIFTGFAATIISGMYISKSIDFSWLGIPRGGMGWKLLHTSVSYLTFLLAAVHTGMNFRGVLRILNPRLRPTVLNMDIKRLAKIAVIVVILIGGVYSFIYLDFQSKANPMLIVQAVQALNENGQTFPQGYRGQKPDHERFSGEKAEPPEEFKEKGKNGPRELQGRGPSGFTGSDGGEKFGPIGLGAKKAGRDFTDVLAFLGVFASIFSITYLTDKFFRNRKHTAAS
jgi:hypothetical protein